MQMSGAGSAPDAVQTIHSLTESPCNFDQKSGSTFVKQSSCFPPNSPASTSRRDAAVSPGGNRVMSIIQIQFANRLLGDWQHLAIAGGSTRRADVDGPALYPAGVQLVLKQKKTEPGKFQIFAEGIPGLVRTG